MARGHGAKIKKFEKEKFCSPFGVSVCCTVFGVKCLLSCLSVLVFDALSVWCQCLMHCPFGVSV